MNWFWGSLFGSILLIVLNTLSKLIRFEGWMILLVSIMSVLTTYCFWYAWQHSDGFLRVWFIQSGLVTVGAFFANAFIIKESWKPETLIAIGLILLGTTWLKFQ